jgi:hypothetical protein
MSKGDRSDARWAVIRASTRPEPRLSWRHRKRTGRMPRFANRVERVLLANDAVPKRRSDRSLIGDLAHLDWRLHLLSAALTRFIGLPKWRGQSPLFETRLMELVSEIDTMGGVCADLKAPITRLLKRKCGYEGLASASLRGASTILQGFK